MNTGADLGGGASATFVGKNKRHEQLLEDIEISQISLSNQDADNCDCSRF
jgi:hypothetical protein